MGITRVEPAGEQGGNKGVEPMEGKIGSILLEPAEKHQKLDGFGTSGCWWAQDVGTWEPDVRERIAEWLFDPGDGIGLTQYRFNVGGGDVNDAPDPWRRVESFETAPGVYDWSRDAGSVEMLRLAVSHGANDVLFFANSPPGRMLENGRTTGDDEGGPNLKQGMEADFSRYLVDVALHFRAEGIPVHYISPVNEPQWNWKLQNGQEGCHYTTQGVMEVGKALVAELEMRGDGIRASLADSGKMWDPAYTLGLYTLMATDPALAGKLPHFSAHAYWSSEQDKKMLAMKLSELKHPLPLWQSEWCQMEGGSDFGMDPALVLARCVHEDLTILDVTAWQTWIGVTRYDYKDGLIHVDPATHKATDMKRLWALGNWSRFVRPGYVRIGAESPDKNLLASAWQSSDGKTTVVVIVNEGTEPVTASAAFAGAQASAASAAETGKKDTRTMTVWETSAERSLEQVSVGGASDPVRFPARSITTLVLEAGNFLPAPY